MTVHNLDLALGPREYKCFNYPNQDIVYIKINPTGDNEVNIAVYADGLIEINDQKKLKCAIEELGKDVPTFGVSGLEIALNKYI